MTPIDRRTLLGTAAAAVVAGVGGAAAGTALGGTRADGQPTDAATPALRRIATEEAWSIPEHMSALLRLGFSTWDNLDLRGRRSITPESGLHRQLVDVEQERLTTMDRHDIAMQVLSLTSPGVQLFDTETAVSLAALANDRLAQIVKRQPGRFAGLASFAPQDPRRAVKEMERAIRTLNLNGFIVNSHTDGHYLDEPRYWEIFEAAEALDRPIYLHPRAPADSMAGPFRDYYMHAAIWGYQAETGTHAMRLMLSGVFDRFPKVKVVLGHMGENIPFHLWRSDNWYQRRRETYPSKLSPSEVFRRNFLITTSGVEHGPVLEYAIKVLGVDSIMWAIDYPYEAMAPAVEFMNTANLANEDRAKIFHTNAERVFHIGAA